MSFTKMSQKHDQFYEIENTEHLDEIINNLIENPDQVNQLINIFLPNQEISFNKTQTPFIVHLATKNQLSNEIVTTPEFLTFFSIGLFSYQHLFASQKVHESLFKNWETTYNKYDEIDFTILFNLTILFHQFIKNRSITRSQLTKITSIFIHFLKIDCISYKFPNTLLFSIFSCFDIFFRTYESSELKQIFTSICAQYTHATIHPFKILLATQFLINNSINYEDNLQLIIHTLQTFNKFHCDSLDLAFSLISNDFCQKLKECSPWSISDAYWSISKFSIDSSQLLEEQINALLTLTFYGVEKRIEQKMIDFDRTINFLSKENCEIPLIQICKNFQFSPTISIRNSQVYIVFQIYSLISEKILRNIKSNPPIYELMFEMEKFGRNLIYFQNIINNLLFLNSEIDNSMFYSVIQFQNPIINRFMKILDHFFLINEEFSNKYDSPINECYEYRDSCDDLLQAFAAQCKENVIIERIWEIVKFTTKKLFEIIRLFPKHIISLIFSKLTKSLFSYKYNNFYSIIISTLTPYMRDFLEFMSSIYHQILLNISDHFYIGNFAVFIKWTNQILTRKPQKVMLSETFINHTKRFVVELFQYAFSNVNSICLYSSILQQTLKFTTKLFNNHILLKVIPCPILINLYFHLPSFLKEHKCCSLFMINLYPSHKSILTKFEWYNRLLLKYAILKPKITIPAIYENNLISKYNKTEAFQQFASDLYSIFDSNKDNLILKKLLVIMISQIPAKYSEFRILPIGDITQSWAVTIVYKNQELVLDCKQLFRFIREIIICEKPENQFERFVSLQNQIKYDIDNLSDLFVFLIQIAFSIHTKCQSVDQYLFIQDILTLIFKSDKNHSKSFRSFCTPSFISHLIVCLVLNHLYSGNDEDELNNQYQIPFEDTKNFFGEVLSELECILYNISYPNYYSASIIGKYLINHFSKSSIDFLELTKFVVKFVLRQLDEKLLNASHHSVDNEVRFLACHYLPAQVFDLVFFIKDNVYDYDCGDFLPLFDLKLPLIATFSLCEIVSKTQITQQNNIENNIKALFESITSNNQTKPIQNYLDKYSKFDLNQLVPLLLLFPSYQERYVDLYLKALSMINQDESLPVLFYLLDLPNDVLHKNFQTIIDNFLNLNQIEALIIAKSIQGIESNFVNTTLTNLGLCNEFFISKDLSDFNYLLPLFVLQPNLIIDQILSQLNLLIMQKVSSVDLIHVNYHYFVNFLTLPMVIQYLDSEKLYKKIGKCLLTIHSQYSFDETNLLVLYFSFNPSIWINYIKKHISDELVVFFFYENMHNEKLSKIVIDIKDDSNLLMKHIQNEYVQFFATENSSISYNTIKDAFLVNFTKCDRRYQQEMIAYLVDNGEIWDLILTFLKSNKTYLIQALQLEIAKNDNHDFETLPNFVKCLSQDYFDPFFSFIFECYHQYFDSDSFSNVVQNIQKERLGVFYGIVNRFKFNFEIDFAKLKPQIKIQKDDPKETRSVYDNYELNMISLYTQNEEEIISLIREMDIDSPSYLFNEIEKLEMTFDMKIIKDFMMRFLFNRKYFLSILKYLEKNYEQPFELFSNELFTFVEFNLYKISDKDLFNCVDCFNILVHFLSNTSTEFNLFCFWASKLSEISVVVLPKFVKDTHHFHKNYQPFFNSLVYLCSIFKSETPFLELYFNLFEQFYQSKNQLMIQELFEFIPLFCDFIDSFNESFWNSFVQLSIGILNQQSKSLFPYALASLKKLNNNGYKISKQLPTPFNLIVKNEIDQLSLSKLNFNSSLPFLNSFKNALYRWFLKDKDTDFYTSVINKVGERNELLTWLAFERSTLSQDFMTPFTTDSQLEHLLKSLPFSILEQNEYQPNQYWSLPMYYLRQLKFIKEKNDKTNPKKSLSINDPSNFFIQFAIEQFSQPILFNVPHVLLNSSISTNEINFLNGVSSCLHAGDSDFSALNQSKGAKSATKFSLFEETMMVIGTPKCYPHQIIEKLGRLKDQQINTLNSGDIIQYLCLASLCNNPIVPPYFTRYHSVDLFNEFARILKFATTKGISVDFTPLDKVKPFLIHSHGNLKNITKLQGFPKTKANFLVYELSKGFSNPTIWANMESIENDDVLYLLLHANKLPPIAKREILKQIRRFPFRWCQLLFDDIQKRRLNESFISLIHDVFRIDYVTVFSEIVQCDELKKIRAKSYFESKIIEDDHISHNFDFSANPMKKLYSLLPVQAPLTENGPLSLYNFPMHSGLMKIVHNDQSYASLSITLADGNKVEYIITGMIDHLSIELPLLACILNKTMRKRKYLREKRVNLISPQGQLISEENNSKLFIFRTTATPLLQHSIYSELVKAKRESQYPPMKELNPYLDLKSKPEFYAWEQTFLSRFSAISHLVIGLNKRMPLPFHLLIDEKNAAVELIFLRDNKSEELQQSKLRLFGQIMDYISPQMAFEYIPIAMVNIATSYQFNENRIKLILANLISKEASDNMSKFTNILTEQNGNQFVEQLISQSCNDLSFIDIPWF